MLIYLKKIKITKNTVENRYRKNQALKGEFKNVKK